MSVNLYHIGWHNILEDSILVCYKNGVLSLMGVMFLYIFSDFRLMFLLIFTVQLLDRRVEMCECSWKRMMSTLYCPQQIRNWIL